MDLGIKEKFIALWSKYFNDTELPICFYYTNDEGCAERAKVPDGHRCIVAALSTVRKGKPLCFDVESAGCSGARRYLGFSEEIMPDFEYFLSCGIPGKIEGERYKRTPELVRQIMDRSPIFKAPARLIVLKRWDALNEFDEPDVVVFFAKPDVIAGLFTLANFDRLEPNGVFAPFAAGCGTIVQYPYIEKCEKQPRGVLGSFDISARPCMDKIELSMAFPLSRFLDLIGYMEESFLITPSWQKVKKRI